eukprot:34838-Chlamydomonas_euryale.AAC.1
MDGWEDKGEDVCAWTRTGRALHSGAMYPPRAPGPGPAELSSHVPSAPPRAPGPGPAGRHPARARRTRWEFAYAPARRRSHHPAPPHRRRLSCGGGGRGRGEEEGKRGVHLLSDPPTHRRLYVSPAGWICSLSHSPPPPFPVPHPPLPAPSPPAPHCSGATHPVVARVRAAAVRRRDPQRVAGIDGNDALFGERAAHATRLPRVFARWQRAVGAAVVAPHKQRP